MLEGVKVLSYAMRQPETNRPLPPVGKWPSKSGSMEAAAWAGSRGGPCWFPSYCPARWCASGSKRRGPGCWKRAWPESSPPRRERVEPPCPYFGRCGGCHYQHAAYEYQLAQKLEVLRDVLRRVGKLEAPERDPGRSRPRRGNTATGSSCTSAGGGIGFREAGSNRLCPVEHCPISSPADQRGARPRSARCCATDRFPRFLRSIELFTNESSRCR